jgi:hypothetical protein
VDGSPSRDARGTPRLKGCRLSHRTSRKAPPPPPLRGRTRHDRFEFLSRGVDAKLHYPIAIHQRKGYPWGQDAETKSVEQRKNRRSVLTPMFELTNDESTAIDQVKWDKA